MNRATSAGNIFLFISQKANLQWHFSERGRELCQCPKLVCPPSFNRGYENINPLFSKYNSVSTSRLPTPFQLFKKNNHAMTYSKARVIFQLFQERTSKRGQNRLGKKFENSFSICPVRRLEPVVQSTVSENLAWPETADPRSLPMTIYGSS